MKNTKIQDVLALAGLHTQLIFVAKCTILGWLNTLDPVLNLKNYLLRLTTGATDEAGSVVEVAHRLTRLLRSHHLLVAAEALTCTTESNKN